MKRFKTTEYESALLKKGFQKERRTKHNIFFLYVGDKKTQVFTMISHGSSQDIGNPLMDGFKRQLKLTNSEIGQFIECPMTAELYLETLKKNGFNI